MKIAARRRLALAGLATSTAVVAGVLVAPGASAAPITDVSPGTVANTASQVITFTNPTPLLAGTATFTRTGAASDVFTAPIRQNAPGQTVTLNPVNFADGGDTRALDGPANPGTYDITLSNPGGSDSCTTCFTVVPTGAGPNGAPTVASLAVDALTQGSSANITVTGTGFTRGSVIEVLRADGTVDPDITENGNPVDRNQAGQDAETTNGNTTATTLRRRFVVSASAVTGPRLVRVTNTDGLSGQCERACFSVNGAPLTSVSPTGDTNNRATPTVVTFRGSGLEGGTPSLAFVGDPGSSTKEALSIIGQNVVFASDRQSVRAEFDLRNAAPGLDAYQPVITQTDGSRNACVATCRFDVLQTARATVTRVTPATGVAGATQTVQVDGTGFSRGVKIDISGGDVTTTSVRFVSPTRVEAVLAVGANAVNGPRNVTPTTTDGNAGTPCTGCYTVTGGRTPASPGPSATPTATTSPRPSPSTSPSGRTASVSVSPSTITSQETARVIGTATPGSLVELMAYSRPSTTYRVVRRGVVGQTGRIEFVVGPSGNTRLFLRATDEDGGDAVDSASVVLTVRTSLNLKVARTGTRTYRFTGSTLPKRRGQLVTVFYETGGRRVIAARARVAQDGTYAVTRQFSGTGTFVFFTATGTDINNAGNESNRLRVAIR